MEKGHTKCFNVHFWKQISPVCEKKSFYFICATESWAGGVQCIQPSLHSGLRRESGDTCAENQWRVPEATNSPVDELLFKKIQRYNLFCFLFLWQFWGSSVWATYSHKHTCVRMAEKEQLLSCRSIPRILQSAKKRVQHKREHLQINWVTLAAPFVSKCIAPLQGNSSTQRNLPQASPLSSI